MTTSLVRFPVILMACLLAASSLPNTSCSSSGRVAELKSGTIQAKAITDLLRKGRAVVVKDCTVEGDLDFTKAGEEVPLGEQVMQVQIGAPLYFEGCHFTGKITGMGFEGNVPRTCRFLHPVTFQQCQVDGEADFSGAVFESNLSFTKSYFEQTVILQAARISGDFRFEEAVFKEDFLMQESVLRGGFWGKNATLLGQFSVQQSDFWQHAVLTGISVHGYMDMSLANFRRAAFFGYGKYYDRAVYSGARFSERAEWTQASYTRSVNLDETTFSDLTKWSGVNMKGGVSMKGARFEYGKPDIDDRQINGSQLYK